MATPAATRPTHFAMEKEVVKQNRSEDQERLRVTHVERNAPGAVKPSAKVAAASISIGEFFGLCVGSWKKHSRNKSSGAVGRRLIWVGVLGLGGGWVRGLCFKFGSVWACDL